MKKQKAEKTKTRIKLGKRIRELRNANDLSVRKLSLMVGTDEHYLSWLEDGQYNPTIDMLDRIAEALGVKTEDLFGS